MADRRPVTDDTVDSKKQRIADREEKRRRNDQLDDLRTVLDLPAGRRFIWRMVEHCGVFRNRWEASARGAFNAGEQNVGHFVLAEVRDASPRMFLVLMGENYAAETKEDEALEQQYRDAEKGD